MKNYFYVSASFILLILAACNTSPSTPTGAAPTTTPTVAVAKTPTKASDLTGIWVNAAYIDDLKHTHSPLNSKAKIGELAVFYFDAATLKGDTLDGGLSFNGHEGGSCSVVFRTPKTGNASAGMATLLPISGIKPEQECGIGIDNGQLIVNAQPQLRYNRIESAQNVDDVVSKAVIQTLFVGDWTMTDADGKVSKIKVAADGKVTGNPDVSTMEVLTDFVADAPPTDEAYFFDGKTKRSLILAFKHRGEKVEFLRQNTPKGKPLWVWTR